MLSQAEIDHEAYEAAWKAQLDYNSYILPQVEAAERIKAAERKGRLEGLLEVRLEARKEALIWLYRQLYSLDELPELPDEEIQSWSIELLNEKIEILKMSLWCRYRKDDAPPNWWSTK